MNPSARQKCWHTSLQTSASNNNSAIVNNSLHHYRRHMDRKSTNAPSVEQKSKVQPPCVHRSGIRSLTELYNKIPDYNALHHLSKEEFMKTLSTLKSECNELMAKYFEKLPTRMNDPLLGLTTTAISTIGKNTCTGNTTKNNIQFRLHRQTDSNYRDHKDFSTKIPAKNSKNNFNGSKNLSKGRSNSKNCRSTLQNIANLRTDANKKNTQQYRSSHEKQQSPNSASSFNSMVVFKGGESSDACQPPVPSLQLNKEIDTLRHFLAKVIQKGTKGSKNRSDANHSDFGNDGSKLASRISEQPPTYTSGYKSFYDFRSEKKLSQFSSEKTRKRAKVKTSDGGRYGNGIQPMARLNHAAILRAEFSKNKVYQMQDKIKLPPRNPSSYDMKLNQNIAVKALTGTQALSQQPSIVYSSLQGSIPSFTVGRINCKYAWERPTASTQLSVNRNKRISNKKICSHSDVKPLTETSDHYVHLSRHKQHARPSQHEPAWENRKRPTANGR